MNLNKVMLIGRLTRDPELRTTPGGASVASMGLATNRTWTDKNGQKQEDVSFHNIVVWGRQAELVSQFLKKGQMAYVEGRLQTRKWQDKDNQTRWTTEVVADRVQFGPKAAGYDERSGSGGGGQSGEKGYSPARRSAGPSAPDKDLEPAPVPEINLDEDEIKPEEVPF